jgi:nicotinamide-nucleotide amidase
MSATEALAPVVPEALDHRTLQVLTAACELDLTLATAESCTGGLLASLLTDVPGCSHAFERGFVTYAEAAKTQMLGVPAALIADQGVVSQPVAVAMAEGAIRASTADLALALTGYCEAPPDDPDAVAGLVHFACLSREGELVTRVETFGDIGRAAVRIACLEVALEMLADLLVRAGAAIAPPA